MRNKISAILSHHLPDFVTTEYDIFVTFIKAYFSFMEDDGNALNLMERFKENLDIDSSDVDFAAAFLTELAGNMPKVLMIDQKQLVKIAKEFYLAKGSEQSFRFLFTILYGIPVDIFYPRTVLHIPSDGKYTGDIYATITANNIHKFGDLLKLDPVELSISMIGETSGSKAIIDSFNITYYESQKILSLNLSSHDGTFLANEPVQFIINDMIVKETIYGVLNSIEVVDGGTGYSLDDVITITDSSIGKGAKAKITNFDAGGFESTEITFSGIGYSVGDVVLAQPRYGSPGYGFTGVVREVGPSGEIVSIRIITSGRKYTKQTYANFPSTSGVGAVVVLNGPALGKIKSVQVYDGGIRYDDPSTISLSVSSSSGSGAILQPKIRGLFDEPKRYTNDDGFPSSYCRIIDSNYYQYFSYVLRSSLSPFRWYNTVKSLNHPAGMKMFGSLLIENMVAIDMTTIGGAFYSILSVMSYLDQLLGTEGAYLEGIFEMSDGTVGWNTLDIDKVKFLDEFTYTIEEVSPDVIGQYIPPLVGKDDSALAISSFITITP